jgi:UDP-N-acetylmuramoylalanine--D-glutamate ligase
MTPHSLPHTSQTARAGRTIVVGLGRTGMSCARYLHSRGIEFAVTDSRVAPPETQALKSLAPGIEMRFGAFDQSLLDGAAQVIASPGVSLDEPFLRAAAARRVAVVGDIELFVREAKAPIAAITGTNGKSTVTTLVARMAEAAGKRAIAAGNLGQPVLDLLDQPVPDIYVSLSARCGRDRVERDAGSHGSLRRSGSVRRIQGSHFRWLSGGRAESR